MLVPDLVSSIVAFICFFLNQCVYNSSTDVIVVITVIRCCLMVTASRATAVATPSLAAMVMLLCVILPLDDVASAQVLQKGITASSARRAITARP